MRDMPRERWWDPYDLAQRLGRRIADRFAWAIGPGLKRVFIVGLVVLVISGAGIEFSSTPRFCVTCHYMRPYYDSWQASSHSDVPCIDCHFPPDIKSMARRKFAASVQVVKYITRQYGTRPWTEIEDSSCLRSGCHERRLLSGKVDFNPTGTDLDILFDHGPHMTSFRRVTRLRCTSCHSQIVQGQHITVTTSTCYLCHFKNMPKTESMRRCTTCHEQPIKTASERGAYNHEPVEARGVGCVECHADVIHGQGAVPPERCLTCHSEPEHLARRPDTEYMHLKHVTESAVDCNLCHQEIQHYLPTRGVPGELDCKSCHPDHHRKTLDMYTGAGAIGAEHVPDPMAASRVSCVSCHRTHREIDGRGVALEAGPAGCMNCHDEKYGKVLAQWRAESTASVAKMQAALARARKEVARARKSGAQVSGAQDLLRAAADNVNLVRIGRGVHNVAYARATLDAAVAQINRAMALVGSSYRARPVSEAAALPDGCLNCHESAPRSAVQVFGLTFKHADHVTTARLKCERCHEDRPPGDPAHGRRRISVSDCRGCHARARLAPHPPGWRSRHGAQARASAAPCRACHTTKWCQDCHGTRMPHGPDWVPSTHGKTATGSPNICATCHQQRDCSICHGERGIRPHSHESDAWRKSHGEKANERLCAVCHGEDSCATCHGGLKSPHPDGWAMAHKPAANVKPASCVVCHESEFCMLCHKDSPPESHTDDFKKKHAPDGDALLCATCHGKDPCMSCHKIPMPHPEGYAMKHKAEASFKSDGVCLHCHQTDLCQLCHADVVK